MHFYTCINYKEIWASKQQLQIRMYYILLKRGKKATETTSLYITNWIMSSCRRPVRCSVETRELLKRGRAYRCLLCQKQVGKKRYIISNIYKYVSRSIRCYTVLLFSVPFQTDDEDKLKDYIKNYAKHRKARESLLKAGKRPEDDHVHFEKLSKEESMKIRAERMKEEGKNRP